MAQDRGGLRYKLTVKDQFSETTKKFRDEIEKSKAAFAELKAALSDTLSDAKGAASLKETAKAIRQVAKSTKELEKARVTSVKAGVEAAKVEKALSDASIGQSSRLNDLVKAQEKAANIVAKNKTGTEEEARIRQRVAQAIVNQTENLAGLQILQQNQTGPRGLKAEQQAYIDNANAVFRNRVEIERLEKARKSNINLRGESADDVAKKQVFAQNRALKETAALEARLAELGENRFRVDQKGRLVLGTKIQAEREYRETLAKRAVEEERIRLLAERGLGTDGLTNQQRALRAYNAELQKLATQEERLNVIRDRGEQAFTTRGARVRAESAALESLIATKTKLLQIELADQITDDEGNTLAQLRAQASVEDRITREKQKQAELEILAARGRGADGLTTDERAIRAYGRELQKLADQEARLAKIQEGGEGAFVERNAQLRAQENRLQELIRTRAKLIELEQAGKAIDDDGTTLSQLRAREKAEARIVRQKEKQIELQLLAQQGRGSDGLTAEERALRSYRAELEKLSEAEERLKLIRADSKYAERTSRIRAEERATKALVTAKEKLRFTELEGSIVDADGRSLTDIRAEETAESRIRRETERRLAAQKEINLRKARGLPISRQLEKQARGLADETERTAAAGNRTIFSFRRLFLIFGAFEAARGAIRSFNQSVAAGVKFNSVLEQAELSIAALISASTDLPGLLGEGTTAAQQLEAALGEARRQNELLRADSLRTTATYEELLKAFQVALAPGVAQGGSLDQVREFTVQISQAASALGLAQNQLSEEIRNIVQGTINIRTTRIAASLGITNEDIRTAKEAGVLFQFLQQRFDAFNEAGIRAQQTFQGLALRIRDAFQQVTGLASADLFETLKVSLGEIFDILGEINDETRKFEPSPRAVAIFRAIFDSLEKIVDRAREFTREFTFENALETAESIGQTLETLTEIALGVVQGIAAGLSDLKVPLGLLQDAFNAESTQEFVKQITRALVSAGALNAVISVGKTTSDSLVGVWETIGRVINGVGIGLLAIGDRFGKVLRFVGKLGPLLAGLAIPLGPFLALVGAVTAAVAAAYLALKGFAFAVTGQFQSLSDSLEVLGIKLQQLYFNILGFLAKIGNFFLGDITEVFREGLDKSESKARELQERLEKVGKAAKDAAQEAAEITPEPAGISEEAFKFNEIFQDVDFARSGGNFFDELQLATSGSRQLVNELLEDLNKLRKEADKADTDLQVEIQTQGVSEVRDFFQQQLETSKGLTEQERLLTGFRAQKARADREILSITASLENLNEIQAGHYKTLTEAAQERARAMDRIRQAEEEITKLTLQQETQGPLSTEDSTRLRELKNQIALEDQALESRIRQSGDLRQLSNQAVQLAKAYVDAQALSIARANDIRDTEEAITEVKREQLRILSKQAAIEAIERSRELREESNELRFQVQAQNQLNDAIARGATERELAALERNQQISNLRRELNLRVQLLEVQADQLEATAQAAFVGGNFSEAAAITASILAIRQKITLLKQEFQAKKRNIELDGDTTEQDQKQARALFQTANQLRGQNLLLRSKIENQKEVNDIVAQERDSQEQSIALAETALKLQARQLQQEETLAQKKLDRAREERRLLLEDEGVDVDSSLIRAQDAIIAELERSLELQGANNDALKEYARIQLEVLKNERDRRALDATDQARTQNQNLALELSQVEDIVRLEQLQAQIDSGRGQEIARRIAQLNLEKASLASNLGLAVGRVQLERQAVQNQLRQRNVSAGERDQLLTQLNLLDEKVRAETTIVQIRQEAIDKLLEEQERLRSGGFVDGLTIGLQRAFDQVPPFAESMALYFQEAMTRTSQAIGDALWLSLTGRTDEIEDVFLSLADSLGQQLSQRLVDQILSSGFSLVSSSTTSSTILINAGRSVATSMVAGATQAALILEGANLASGAAGAAGGGYRGGLISGQGYAVGGQITGQRAKPPANVNPKDNINIWAQAGEYVLRRAAVKKYGIQFIRMLNSGMLDPARLPGAGAGGYYRGKRNQGFNSGGLIGNRTGSAATGSSSNSEVKALPVLVADPPSVRRFLAGGRGEVIRFLSENGYTPG